MTNFFECDKIINIKLNVKIKRWRESKVSIDVVEQYLSATVTSYLCENWGRVGGIDLAKT